MGEEQRTRKDKRCMTLSDKERVEGRSMTFICNLASEKGRNLILLYTDYTYLKMLLRVIVIVIGL